MEKKSPHFYKGSKNKLAFVFSCPGQKEVEENRPAAGQTGKNLDLFCKLLKLNREEITITNSCSEPFFGKRTEPTSLMIKKVGNLNRISRELKDIKGTIICFGKKADIAISACKNKGLLKNETISVRHLSLQSINQIKVSSKTPKNERTRVRIERVVRDVKELKKIISE